MSRRSLAVLAALAVVATGCGTPGDDSDDTLPPATPAPTVAGVGQVPAVPSAVRVPIVVVRPPVNVDGTEAQLIGQIADGNRILMIGDSILASTSSRYGDHMCEAVVPLGWQVAVEAEPSRFIDFGTRVLDKMLLDDPTPEADWNAAVVFLGSNYSGDEMKYEAELVRILDRLAPRPTLLLTVTEYRPDYVEVNEVVNRLGAARDNVTVLDWKTISETPGVLSGDRLHPTDAGRPRARRIGRRRARPGQRRRRVPPLDVPGRLQRRGQHDQGARAAVERVRVDWCDDEHHHRSDVGDHHDGRIRQRRKRPHDHGVRTGPVIDRSRSHDDRSGPADGRAHDSASHHRTPGTRRTRSLICP